MLKILFRKIEFRCKTGKNLLWMIRKPIVDIVIGLKHFLTVCRIVLSELWCNFTKFRCEMNR